MVLYRGVFVLGCLVSYGSGATSMEGESARAIDTNFKAFMLEHGRMYKADSHEFEMRKAIFAKATEQVARHNRQSSSYRVGINKLSDQTPEELARLRGWKNSRRPKQSSASRVGSSAVHFISTDVTVTELPMEHNWMNLTSVKEIQDQGGCGSCWAFAAATVLRAHSEIWMKDPRKFSVQQIISCTPNPEECGGTGGCQGATAELAMDYVFKHGCQSEEEMPYTAKDSACPASLIQEEPPEAGKLTASAAAASLGMVGWTKLPENKVNPVKLALVTKGPVGVSISAGDSWNRYDSGVLDDCVGNAVIDHAVVLIGYGKSKSTTSLASLLPGFADTGLKYWHLQNSWGTDWGEKGYLRMLRREDDFEETTQCGTDNDPQIGSGCKGGPAEVRVCGMCGLLYDTVIPHFSDRRGQAPAQLTQHKHNSFLHQHI